MMKEKPKRLKGTVLFTVVSVMMVMVVFLLGTLALAATASNRAYSNYQKEQTEYTSRAVLDSVVQAIQDDSDIKKAVLGLPVGSGMTITVNAQDGSDPHEVTVTNNGPGHQSYDPNVVNGTKKGAWLDNNEYLLSVTVGKTMAQTTYTAKLAGVIQPTQTTNNPGGAFVSLGDMDGHEIATHGFTTGGSYIGVGGTPVAHAFSSSGDQTIDGPFYLNGDCTVNTEVYMHFTRAEDFMVIMGDLTIVNGNLKTVYDGFKTDAQMKDASGDYVYEKIPYIYVNGKISKSNAVNFVLGENGFPLNIYAGSIEANANTQIYGDLYTFDATETNTWGDPNGGANSKLYKWTSATLKRNDESGSVVSGSWYSKGAISIKGGENEAGKENTFQGDIRCEDDITISGKSTVVGGDIVCAGTLTINGTTVSCKNLYVGTLILNGGTLDCSGKIYAGEVQGTPPKPIEEPTISLKGSSSYLSWYEDVDLKINHQYLPRDEAAQWWTNVNRRSYELSYTECKEVNGVVTKIPFVLSGHRDWNEGDGSYQDAAAYKNDVENIPEVKHVLDYSAEHNSRETAENVSNNSYDVKAAYGGKDIYPENYTKDYLNQNKIQQPLGSAYEYPDSPEELGAGTTIYDKNATPPKYTIPTYYQENLPKISVGVMGGTGGSYRLVSNNCVLTGKFTENVYINADLPITVVLQNVEFEGNDDHPAGIIINDEKQVTLFVDGYVNLGTSGQGTAIITECLMNAIRGGTVNSGAWKYSDSLKGIMGKMKNDITISQQSLMTDAVHFPNVIIYGNEGSILKVGNKGLVTAQIRANKMIYQANESTNANKKITYVTPDTYPDGMEYGADTITGRKGVGLIGQLIAGDIYLEGDGNWGMLYTTEGQNTCSCCEHCTNDPECKCTCTTCKCKSGSLTPGGTPTDYKVVSYEYY